MHGQPRVLIAGVDGPLRALLTETLERDGYVVTHAGRTSDLGCGTVAGLRRALQTAAPDIVVCDLGAPSRSALEQLRRLRRLDWAIPLVVIARRGDAIAIAEADRLACLLFEAPVELDDLRTVVQNLAWVR